MVISSLCPFVAINVLCLFSFPYHISHEEAEVSVVVLLHFYIATASMAQRGMGVSRCNQKLAH